MRLLARRRPQGAHLFAETPSNLDLIQDFFAGAGYEAERLDGNTSAENRQAGIDIQHSRMRIRLLVVHARPVRLTTSPSRRRTYIIFDSDWNPQNDLQAMARCHRIGQTKESQGVPLRHQGHVRAVPVRGSCVAQVRTRSHPGRRPARTRDDGATTIAKDGEEQAQRINELLKFGVHGALRDASGEEADAFAAEDIDGFLSWPSGERP